MLNKNFDEKFGKQGITFDDVLLIPGESNVEPRNVSVDTYLTKKIHLNTPIMTAAMDTVTETAMAIAIAREGGIGIIHKNMSIEAQADMVDRVKRSENGVIVNPFFLSPESTVGDADALMAKYKISGVPICENGKLVGIITNRDMRFMSPAKKKKKISEVMTKEELVTSRHRKSCVSTESKSSRLPTTAATSRVLSQSRISKNPSSIRTRRVTKEVVSSAARLSAARQTCSTELRRWLKRA